MPGSSQEVLVARYLRAILKCQLEIHAAYLPFRLAPPPVVHPPDITDAGHPDLLPADPNQPRDTALINSHIGSLGLVQGS
jgi:hypothetical protein